MTDDFLARFEARRQARANAERSFALAGETLRFRATVAPEVMFRFRESQRQMFEHLEALAKWSADADKASKKNGQGEADLAALMERMPEQKISDDEALHVADETVLACLEDDSREAWGRLRAQDAEQPLTYQDIFDIVGYLLGRVTDLPTVAPIDSSPGRTQTGSKSKGASSSQAKTPASSP